MNINDLLRLYLGADDKGGYQPIGAEERMREAFPKNYEDQMRQIAPYLNEDHEPDWQRNDLNEEANLFEEALHMKYPELDEVTVRALANRWAYGWK